MKEPVKISSVELLQNGKVFLIRTRSTDGVEAVTAPNPTRMALMHPIILRQVVPFFLGKDARDLERLLWKLYRHDSNYKLQGLALWVCVGAIEMALLELMGRTAQRPIADFFGGRVRENIPVYVASSNRGLGYLDVVRFASFTPNIGDFMEFKGNTNLPVACETSSLKCECGEVRCRTGPGFGVTVDPAYVKKARAVGSGA